MTQAISQLCPGTYRTTVTDANGCTAVATTIVGQFPPLSIAGTVINSACPVPCTGSIVLTVSGGGNPPYAYLWSNGAVVPNPTNLCPGVYGVTVTSASGCSSKRSFTVGLGPGHCRTDEGETPTNGNFAVYPNPTSNAIYVSCNGEMNLSVTIEVYDILGRKLFRKNVADQLTTIDVSQRGQWRVHCS